MDRLVYIGVILALVFMSDSDRRFVMDRMVEIIERFV